MSWQSSVSVDIKEYIGFPGVRLPSNVEMLRPERDNRGSSEDISFSTNIARSAVNNFYYETNLARFDVRQLDLFRCYGLRTALTQTMEIFPNLKGLLKTYSPEFFILDHSANIPTPLPLGRGPPNRHRAVWRKDNVRPTLRSHSTSSC